MEGKGLEAGMVESDTLYGQRCFLESVAVEEEGLQAIWLCTEKENVPVCTRLLQGNAALSRSLV